MKKVLLIAAALGVCIGIGSMLYPALTLTATVATVNPQLQLERTWLAGNRQNFGQVRNALTQYYLEKLAYPDALEALVPVYMAKVPPEAKTGTPFSYAVVQGGADYRLCMPAGTEPPACATKDTNPESLFSTPAAE